MDKLPASNETVKISVLLSVFFVFALVISIVALGGAYFLSLHAVEINTATQHALVLREQTAALRSGIPTCRALYQLSHDSSIILNLPGTKHAPASAKPIIEFFQDFPKVFKATNCQAVLSFAKKEHL